MTPVVIHRFSIPALEAVRALFDVGDCQEIQVVMVGENLVVDVIKPAGASAPDAPADRADDTVEDDKPDTTQADPHPEPDEDSSADITRQPEDERPEDKPAEKKEELKGGPLAKRAGICCDEKGFWTFLGVSSAEEAKADVYRRCGVESRKELDLGGEPATRWNNIETKYRLWLGGHDVDID